jgi:hypothetical protein
LISSGFSRIDKAKQTLLQSGVIGVETKVPLDVESKVTFEVEIFVSHKKMAFKVLEGAKIEHDLRFNKQERSVLESSKFLLLGDENFTLSK